MVVMVIVVMVVMIVMVMMVVMADGGDGGGDGDDHGGDEGDDSRREMVKVEEPGFTLCSDSKPKLVSAYCTEIFIISLPAASISVTLSLLTSGSSAL